jgi:hypothetical protein
MAGIIINIPTPQLINPTSEFIPVNNAGLFVDSNIKNIVNDKIETKNVFDEIVGLRLDFINNEYIIGDPISTNFIVDTINQTIAINGITLPTATYTLDKILPIKVNGTQYYIQLFV